MIDAHCHLDAPEFDVDRDAVVERALRAGIEHIVVPGVDLESSERAAALRASYPCTIGVGLHPERVGRVDAETIATSAARCGAGFVGECGLDRRVSTPLAEQLANLTAHLVAARELRLPIVLHVVRRHEPMVAALRAFAPIRGMVHAFTGPRELVDTYVALGLHLSVGGAATRGGARRVHAAVAAIPAERLVVETDSPDQPPLGAPHSRNEPSFLPLVVAAVASLRDEPAGTLAARSAALTRDLFSIR